VHEGQAEAAQPQTGREDAFGHRQDELAAARSQLAEQVARHPTGAALQCEAIDVVDLVLGALGDPLQQEQTRLR